MHLNLRLASGLAAALWLTFASTPGAAQGRDQLPLVIVQAPAGTDGPMVLLLSGDGDWAPFPRQFGELAAAHGAPVLGLKMRSYLMQKRTPEEMAAALAPAVRAHLTDWKRSDLKVVGYSRGADVAAFVVNRWPEDLRAQVSGIAFVGLSERASFEFHYADLALDIKRATDLPTRPEVEKLVGVPMWCVRGADETDSFCDKPVSGMRVATHPGSHRAGGDDATVQLVLHELGLDR
ncbi:MAG TPA: AcvB/VirJ family lysyl-phosphatidylglycerol hydrolase [Gammaproteobacteria bacterium]|jgi:type IV secretory pathway VirJ component|nr:AcvB/VirJ family lysyl-phosphatidylglycerol hydrolase [Gammaproteobacteria bacterium]